MDKDNYVLYNIKDISYIAESLRNDFENLSKNVSKSGLSVTIDYINYQKYIQGMRDIESITSEIAKKIGDNGLWCTDNIEKLKG